MIDLIIRGGTVVEGIPIGALEQGVAWDWTSFGDWLNRLEGNVAVNAAFLVGHSMLRRAVMGADAVRELATHEHIAAMAEVAAARGMHPVDVLIDMVLPERLPLTVMLPTIVPSLGASADGWRARAEIWRDRRVIVDSGPPIARWDLPGGGERLYAESVGVTHVFVGGTDTNTVRGATAGADTPS
ncbi:unannotated protein [freshwater metagenome]|uniref:Unannotated protein n=2 Tax=freshwater metagenome TaxID=449393 RepID=A0A6J6TLY0_9ZZZZ|nr:hypothetical protein [Actinomycetota bacterium]